MKKISMNSNRELISPSTLHPTPGYSHIALAKGTRLAFIAGQVALDQKFSVISENDLSGQTEAAMRNLDKALAAIGAYPFRSAPKRPRAGQMAGRRAAEVLSGAQRRRRHPGRSGEQRSQDVHRSDAVLGSSR